MMTATSHAEMRVPLDTSCVAQGKDIILFVVVLELNNCHSIIVINL